MGREEIGRGLENRWLLLALSFLVPFVILLVGCFALGVTPFGDHSLALTDAKYYLNGLLAHARMLRNPGSLLYSLDGLGGNSWAGKAWGDFHPVKLLSLLATIDTIPTWFTWICLVNMSLCGMTMYLLLAGLYGQKDTHLLFSSSYALMGFNVANCFQPLFFIGPQMLPLMVLGLIRLCRGRSPALYVGSLTFCIFCNFYFGLMLCIASVIIFLCWNYLHWEERRETRFRIAGVYAGASLVSGLLPCFFWLPALKAFSGGGRLNQTKAAEYQFTENMPFVQIFSKLFTGANSANEEVLGLPNIFCGILVVFLVILFFMNKKISSKKKKAAGAVLLLYLLTFYIKAFTLAMHGFTHTNWFPYRYSYVFSFFLIWIAVEEFQYYNELTVQEIKQAGIGLLLAVLVVFSTQYEFISGGEVLLDLTLLTLMCLGFYAWKTIPKKFGTSALSAVLAVCVSINLFANFALSTHKLQSEDGWELNLEVYRANTLRSGALIDGILDWDKSFFRMEKDFSESGSAGADAGLYGYRGISSSGPAIRMFVHQQLNKLGVNWFDMRHWYSEGIPAATDCLLGLKYLVTSKDLGAEKGYNQRIELDGSYIFENPSALSLSILADQKSHSVELGDDAFENLNHVWKAMTGGDKDIFTEQEDVTFRLHNSTEEKTLERQELLTSISQAVSESNTVNGPSAGYEKETPSISYIECSFIAQRDGPVYYFDTSVPASENGRPVPCVECVGVFKKGDTVTHYFTVGDPINGKEMADYCSTLTYAYADNKVLADYAAQLNARDCTFNVEKDDHLSGSFTAEANQCILFTTPWDEGWTCYIDGQKVPIDKTWDLFMSVKVPEGEHTYEMKFFPAWMDIGIGISCVALLGVVALMVLWKRSSRRGVQAVEVIENK